MSWYDTAGYRDFRPPYLPSFFDEAARRLGLCGREAMLDLGCGMGAVAFGLAPHVASVTGVDPDLPSLQFMAEKARALGRDVRLVHARAEEAPPDLGPFDLITVGKAFAFMNSAATLERIDRWLRPGGQVLLCNPVEMEPDGPPWKRVFFMVLMRWSRSETLKRLILDQSRYFKDTDFVQADRIDLFGERTITLDDLLNRAFGYVGTTRAELGADADGLIDDLRRLLARFFAKGPIVEKLHTTGVIFRRRGEIAASRS